MPGKEFYRWQVRSFTVLLSLDAVERLNRALRHPHISTAEENGGLLLGQTLDANTVEVTDFELVRSSHRRGIAYDLSPTERDRVGRHVQRIGHRRGPRPVGCFRTHLRPGLFLDQSDVALITETGFDGSGIALAIRMNQSGPAEAGIFFREDDDVDGRQPALKFPLDVEALRLQGPIETKGALAKDGKTGGAPRIREHMRKYRQSVRSKALVSALTYGLAGAVLALAIVAGLYDRGGVRSGVSGSRAQSAVSNRETGSLGPGQSVQAPPPVFDDALAGDETVIGDDGETTGSSQPAANENSSTAPSESPTRSPFESTERNAPPAVALPARQVQHVATVSPAAAPPQLSPSDTALSSPPLTSPPIPLSASPPANPVPVLEPVAVPPPPARRDVSVDVSIEPREDGTLKRAVRTVPAAMGHVPLLGRLPGLRHDGNEDLVPARPDANLRPQIPAAVSRSLAEQVEVDVDASIDNQGSVRSTEVVRGDDAQLAELARNAVRAAHWKPAHSGDRKVAMNVVVHYRFNPTTTGVQTAVVQKEP